MLALPAPRGARRQAAKAGGGARRPAFAAAGFYKGRARCARRRKESEAVDPSGPAPGGGESEAVDPGSRPKNGRRRQGAAARGRQAPPSRGGNGSRAAAPPARGTGRGGGRGAAAAAGRGAAPAPALVLITRYQMRAGRHACRGEEAGRSGFGRYMSERVGPHHRDERGAARAALAFGDVVATGFAAVGVGSAALPRPPPPPADAWRVGESLAECFLEDHEGASFPHPYSRDQRNPLASPAGPDLAGYCADGGETVFLFGEVKTTGDKSRPPSVVRDLRRQMEMLRPGENRPVF